MTLKRINSIKSFGIYEDFSWHSDTPEFKIFNVFYGWNYSGKTTLSRIFRCLETGKVHADYDSCSFQFEDNSGNTYTPATMPSSLIVRVFNSDFINENLKWNEGIEPILLLGSDNIDLQKELEVNKYLLDQVELEIRKLKGKKIEKEQSLALSLSTKASELRYEYSLVPFDKRHFEPLVISAHLETNRTLRSEEDIALLKSTLLRSDKKQHIVALPLVTINMSQLAADVNVLLNKTVTSQVIEKLKQNVALNEWVKTGKDLHKEKNECQFCGATLKDDLLVHLENHFSKDYDYFLSSLDMEIAKLEKRKVKMSLPDTANFYSELQLTYKEKRNALATEVTNLNNTLEALIAALQNKKTRAFGALSPIELDVNSDLLLSITQEINLIIEGHNTKTNDYELIKSAARTEVLENYALEFVIKHQYEEKVNEINDLDELIRLKDSSVPAIRIQISNLENQLSETVKGADTINDYLSRYFGKQDIQIAITSDNKFQLLRQGRKAKNLSEGEKTAIAFAYFTTRLRDKNTTLQNTIVYIDDPISSLDSNHLFNTYSFIRDTFYEFDPNGNPKHRCKCAQFFISTHNFEFFNLIKAWFEKIKSLYTSFYLISRSTNTKEDKANISPLNNHLIKFKSEYSYLFSIIISFKKNPIANFNELYNLPNILRRFIETFTAFKFLSTVNIEENIDRLITDPVDCERVRKFVHYHTHSLNTSKLEQFSDLGECVKVVEIVISAIESVDPIHFRSLLAENPQHASSISN
jgi:wobble nucleotide-excising tRNase